MAETYYQDLCKPMLSRLLALFKANYTYTRASECYLYTVRDGCPVRVLDCVGGYGSTILGHNPKILTDELKLALDNMLPSHAQGSVRAPAGDLAHIINDQIRAGFSSTEAAPYIVHLVNTGTEATEGALKHALMAWQSKQDALIYRLREKRSFLLSRQALGMDCQSLLAEVDQAITRAGALVPSFVALEGGFHGKTAGSLAVTDSSYSHMYQPQALKRIFISHSITAADIEQVFDFNTPDLGAGETICTIAGAIIEVIQGEGGIKPVPHSFVHSLHRACRRHGSLFMVDEVQSGMYRTGSFLATEQYGVLPDCITLGKALGGGMTKIAAILINKDVYCPMFSMMHTSTFAEDDLSALVACRTIGFLASCKPSIAELADEFCKRMLDGISAIGKRYPGTIKDVRGSGFLVGIEFAADKQGYSSAFMTLLVYSGFFAPFLSSYLLNHHNIRVAATISNPQTLRIEPPMTITAAETRELLSAIEDMTGHIYTGRFLALSSHIWLNPSTYLGSSVSSFIPSREPKIPGINHVAFLTHLIDKSTLISIDPLFNCLEDADIEYFLKEIGPLTQGAPYHRQIVDAPNGKRVQLTMWGAAVDSRFFERSLRSGSSEAYDIVRRMAVAAIDSGATHLGLGQFTSIVTGSGLHLSDLKIPITTGNSFTVGSSFMAIRRIVSTMNTKATGLRIGVVGAAGNIGRTMASLATDIASELLIIHHEDINKSKRFQVLLADILRQAPATCSVTAHSRLEPLSSCDVVILCVNSTKAMIGTDHIKQGAIVLDISVPSVLSSSVVARVDVTVLYGGTIKLPLGQKLNHPTFDVFENEVFACLAETLITGLLDELSCFSMGPLVKARVLRSIELAGSLGFTLGRSSYVKRR